jgi:hypothetical protein
MNMTRPSLAVPRLSPLRPKTHSVPETESPPHSRSEFPFPWPLSHAGRSPCLSASGACNSNICSTKCHVHYDNADGFRHSAGGGGECDLHGPGFAPVRQQCGDGHGHLPRRIDKFGSAQLNASGAATFTTTSLAAGSHSITASYGGDTNDSPSTSSPIAVHLAAGTAPAYSMIVSSTSVNLTQGQAANLMVTLIFESLPGSRSAILCPQQGLGAKQLKVGLKIDRLGLRGSFAIGRDCHVIENARRE